MSLQFPSECTFSPLASALSLALAAALFSTTASAQSSDTTEPPVTTLQTVVVTASGSEQDLRDAPASVSVISREDLERRPVQELAELLGTVEGVTLSRSGNLVPGVQLRGLGSAYTLMLIDGKRVNATSVMFRGNDYDTGWVPVEEIERIEIVRGPMSSLYGSDAIGGVINIITRPVGKKWRGSARAGVIVQQDGEAGDSQQAGFSVSGPLIGDTLGLKITGSYDHRKADGDINSAVSGTTQRGFQKIENRYLSGQLAWKPGDNQTVLLDLDDSRRDHAGFIVDRNAYSLRHKAQWGDIGSELTFAGDRIHNRIGVIEGQINPSTAKTYGLNGKFTKPIAWGNQFLTAGFELRREELHDKTNLRGLPGTEGYDRDPNASINQYALFVEDEIRFTDRLALTVGNRWDHHENFGGHNSPRAYLVYHLTDSLTIKGGLARAFRAPTLLQGSSKWGSVSCGSATVGCYITGSDLLQPETGKSQEIALLFNNKVHSANLTFFSTRLNNMIDITSRTANRELAPTYENFVGFLPDGRPIFRYQNIARVRSRGIEAGWRATLSPQWSLRANYTYTDAKNLSGSIPLPLTYRPRHVANVGVDWQANASLTLGLSARYNGAQFISVPSNGLNLVSKSDYTVADVTVNWRITPMFSLNAGVLNANNKTFDRVTGADFNEEGRRYFATINARF